MKNAAVGTSLKLVEKIEPNSAEVVVLEQPSDRALEKRLLLNSADTIEARIGKNAYSDYIRHHRRLPDPKEASTIGSLIGGRVRASDGTLQPLLSNADREWRRQVRSRRKEAARRYQQILRFRQAIVALAQNEDDPLELIAGDSVLFDVDEIAQNMDRALDWLSRFAEEWHRHGKKEARP
ncbi:hypothetical protein KQX63_12940 [Rhodopseudomonas palustris]|uniref:hypothetical protein n=1 Tax=Rhodopseudomonas palustris TaxID=1076 RepID=UPI0021F2514C|nr:hypothetical protein [Rhodopseudomonas palustris]UYO42320.1 hypothetical protein KQX63_12940 [Rhodopseudomonas palustris]